MLNTYLPTLNEAKVTCNTLSDGAGAVFLRIYTAILYSYKIGGQYIHTPVFSLDHNYTNDLDYESRWEKYFGFLSDFTKIKDSHIIISIESLKHLFLYFIYFRFLYSRRIVFKFKFHNPDYIGLNPSEFTFVNSLLKKNILSIEKTTENNGKLNVFIHIRRGDVSIDNNSNRYTHNSLINSNINDLKDILDRLCLTYSFHLISEGSIQDFDDINNVDFYHLNGNPIHDFDKMLNADILFTSKSSFSYLSALFCSGIVIYEEFWLSPLDNWFTINQKSNLFNYLSKSKCLTK